MALLSVTTVFAKNSTIPDEQTLIEHHHYHNSSGHLIHSPAHSKNGSKPIGASAKCRDGSYSFSEHHRGACSRHGGVSLWYS